MEDLIIPKRVLDKKRLKEETISFVSADFFSNKAQTKKVGSSIFTLSNCDPMKRCPVLILVIAFWRFFYGEAIN